MDHRLSGGASGRRCGSQGQDFIDHSRLGRLLQGSLVLGSLVLGSLVLG